MATITGRFGAVQRVLPSKQKIVRPDSSADIEIYGWNGFKYERQPDGKDIVIAWDVLNTGGSFPSQWTKKARMEASGLEPAILGANYSNMVSAVQSWTLDVTAQTQTYTASNMFGFNAKYAGVKSCSGTITGIGAFPPVRPGNRFLFLGFVGPDNGQEKILENGTYQYNKLGYVYQVAAVATSISVNINYSTFAPITWSVQWQSDYKNVGDELWVVGTPCERPEDALGFVDTTDPPCGEAMASRTHTLLIKPDQGCPGDSVVTACLESANITFNTQSQTVSNSCSAAAGGWQTSTVGVTDVTLNTTIHGSSFGVFSDIDCESNPEMKNGSTPELAAANIAKRSKKFYPGVDRYVEIYLGDYPNSSSKAPYGVWAFNKLYVGSFTGMNVDIAGGGVVSFSTQLEFNASPKTYLKDGVCVDESQGCESGFIKYRLPDKDRTNETLGWESFLDMAKYRSSGFKPNMVGRSTMANG